MFNSFKLFDGEEPTLWVGECSSLNWGNLVSKVSNSLKRLSYSPSEINRVIKNIVSVIMFVNDVNKIDYSFFSFIYLNELAVYNIGLDQLKVY